LVVTVRPIQSLLLLLYFANYCIIIIFYPRQSLFSEHTRIQLVTRYRVHLYFLTNQNNQIKPCALTAENARLVSDSSSNIDLCVMSVIILSVNNYKRVVMIIETSNFKATF